MNNPNHHRAPDAKLAFSREESAALLGVSTVTIDRLVRRGLLFPSRATRRPIFPTWELERFLRASSSSFADDGSRPTAISTFDVHGNSKQQNGQA